MVDSLLLEGRVLGSSFLLGLINQQLYFPSCK